MKKTMYLKLDDTQAEFMTNRAVIDMFGKSPTRFKNYTFYYLDESTGDKYWCIQDYWKFDVFGWLEKNYPSLHLYSHDFVKKFETDTNKNFN